MATNIIGSLTDEEISEIKYLLQLPKEREKIMSSLLEHPRETYCFILGLCMEILESNFPFCKKVSVLSRFTDFIKSEPKLLQCAGEDKIEAFERMLEPSLKKIGPHTRGCSMCDPMCFAPPRQYFNTCAMLANRR